MDRAQKQDAVETLKGVFAGSGAVVVTHYMGLTVAEMTDLRGKLRSEGAQLQVVKNTLALKALDGSIGGEGDALFKGPVAIAFAPDPVSAAKVATQYAKDNEKFVIKGGSMPNALMSPAEIKTLATMPSRDELIAKLMGTMQAPVAKFVRTMNEVPAGFARVLAAVRDQKEKQAA